MISFLVRLLSKNRTVKVDCHKILMTKDDLGVWIHAVDFRAWFAQEDVLRRTWRAVMHVVPTIPS